MMKKKWSVLVWIPAVIMLLFIFILSSEKGIQSHNLSERIVSWMLSGVERIMGGGFRVPGEALWKLDYAIRKVMHITEYAFLSMTIILPLYLKHIRGIRLFLLCYGICFLYACFDEFHQYFIEDRNGIITDVLIDCLGVLIGLLFSYFMISIIRAVIKRKNIKYE